MTYRPGNHHGVTIVNETDTTPCGRPGHDCARGHLVAVVVNGDQALAERICELLNDAHTPDVSWTRGGAEALADIRRRLDGFTGPHIRMATLRRLLQDAAASLGVDEDTPPGPPAKPWECKLVREHNPETDPCDCRVSQFCAMGHSLDDAPPSPLRAPVTAQEPPTVGQDRPDAHSGSQAVALDGKPGCPEREWDGPCVMRCGRGAAGGECPRHGTYDLADVPERKAGQA